MMLFRAWISFSVSPTTSVLFFSSENCEAMVLSPLSNVHVSTVQLHIRQARLTPHGPFVRIHIEECKELLQFEYRSIQFVKMIHIETFGGNTVGP